MNYEEYLAVIASMLKELDETDSLFIKQIYTIVHRHLVRKGKR